MRLRHWLREQSFTLSLSSGYFSLYAYCGMLSALERDNLFPSAVTGSSSGALIGGCWAAGCPVREMQDLLFRPRKSDFWDPGWGLGLLKGRKFRSIVQRLAPVARLEHCAVPAAISVFEIRSRRTHVLRSGPLSESLYASCAIPVLFQPMWLDGHCYVDGGIGDQVGLAGAAPGSPILHLNMPMRQFWPFSGYRSAQPELPRRQNMVSIVPLDLIAVGPNHLQNGKTAFAQGQCIMRKALDRELGDAPLFVRP